MNRMSKLIIAASVLSACLVPPGRAWAQEPAAPAAKNDAKTKAEKITALLQDAYGLQTRKRYLDALSKITEAEALDPKNPEVYNLRGSAYLAVQLRDLAQARANFEKARDLSPGAVPPLFNLAEVEFVAGNFDKSEKGFADLVTKFDRLPLSMRHMMQFKVLISQVKQGKKAEAEATMKNNFTFMDDTPAYYFAKALLALDAKNEREGNEWLTKGQIIFKKADTSAYVDSLMESHYIHSIDIPEGAGTEDAPVKAVP